MDAYLPRSIRRLSLLLFAMLMVLAGPVTAAVQPVSVGEICLLLRGGYSRDEVLRETAGRPLLEPLDAAGEKLLAAAGADAQFITALRASHSALSDEEALAERERRADIERRNLESWENNQARLLQANKQNFNSALTAHREAASHHMADLLRGKLVTMRDGQMRPYDDQALADKRIFALYFGAIWCAPCRKFTPQLVEFYKKFAPTHPELEVVLISQDHSAFAMENYMRQDGMPWAALAFERRGQEKELTHYLGSGIPDLVIVDGSGRVLSDSFQGDKYVGPQRVLADLVKVLSAGGG